MNVRKGSRVYWHGTFPNPQQAGTVVAEGNLRHIVRWDNRGDAVLVWANMLGKIVDGRLVCPLDSPCGYCHEGNRSDE